jgi:transposase
MEQQRLRTSYQCRLTPTPAQALEVGVPSCRTLDNCALQQRRTWRERGQGKRATYLQQATELPDLKAACPPYAEVQSQVLQDVLRRVDKTYQAFFRRVQHAQQHAQTPGCGLVLDREENAAKTMLQAGQARRGAVARAAVLH